MQGERVGERVWTFETNRSSHCAQVCLERAMKRGQAGGAMARTDDNLESFKKR